MVHVCCLLAALFCWENDGFRQFNYSNLRRFFCPLREEEGGKKTQGEWIAKRCVLHYAVCTCVECAARSYLQMWCDVYIPSCVTNVLTTRCVRRRG